MPIDAASDPAPVLSTELLAPDLAPVPAPAPTLAPGELSAKTLEEAPIEAAGELVSAVRTGNWRKTVAFALSLLMLGVGRFRGKFKFLKGDRAGVVILFTMSAAGALSTSLLGNAPIDYRMFMAALEIGLYAMGGFLGVKKFFWPDDDPVPDPLVAEVFPDARLVTK
jgi:hypothetical protein